MGLSGLGNPAVDTVDAGDGRRQAPSHLTHWRGANISHAALHNRRLLLHEIRANPGIDRASLARITELTQPAVFKIVAELLEDGWIAGTRIQDGSRGQPRSTLAINPHAAYSLGLNIDRDRLSLVALDFAGDVRMRLHQETSMASPHDARAFVERCIGTIRARRLFPMHKVVAVGLAMPDDYSRTQATPDRGTEWADVFGPLNHLPIIAENDVAAASIGEMKFGVGLTVPSFFYVYIGVGLGGGLVVNRQYVRGRQRRSGELGYLPHVNPFRQRKTALGRTIEQVVSLQGLADALDEGEGGTGAVRILDDACESDQSRMAAWVEEASELLYLPLLSVLCTMAPEAILVGGRLPRTVLERLCLDLSRRLSMNVGVHWPEMVVRPGKLAEDAAAAGAAILALSTLHDRRDDD